MAATVASSCFGLAVIGLDQTRCQEEDGTTTFSLNGTVSGGTPMWSEVGTTGSASSSIETPNSAATDVDVTGIRTVTLQLTVTSDATPSCGEASDEVVLTVNMCNPSPVPHVEGPAAARGADVVRSHRRQAAEASQTRRLGRLTSCAGETAERAKLTVQSNASRDRSDRSDRHSRARGRRLLTQSSRLHWASSKGDLAPLSLP
jgi:hypothetical protein